MITVADIPAHELVLIATQAGGPGGQHVNKVATAIQLHFDIRQSSLPDWLKSRLIGLRDHRVTETGAVVIKASRHRSQERNRRDALSRLDELLAAAQAPRKVRVATRPTRSSRQARLNQKKNRGQVKKLRGPVDDN